MGDIENEISNRKSQQQKHVTQLSICREEEKQIRNEKVPTIRRLEKVQLDKPMVY